jgi:hypothetical protein
VNNVSLNTLDHFLVRKVFNNGALALLSCYVLDKKVYLKSLTMTGGYVDMSSIRVKHDGKIYKLHEFHSRELQSNYDTKTYSFTFELDLELIQCDNLEYLEYMSA